MILIKLAIWCAFAYWTYTIAKRNGRDTDIAIIFGLLFGLGAVIVYAIMGPTKEEKIRRSVEIKI